MKTAYDFSGGKRGPVVKPLPGKTRITIRLDDDVLKWFRQQTHAAGGGSYQRLINQALRQAMETDEHNPLNTNLRRIVRQELARVSYTPHRRASSR
jgi:hypothetical protein